MTTAGYLAWLGIAAVVGSGAWLLCRRVQSPVRRLALRCLVVAAAVTPQPLWIPGEGGAVMPAILLLLYGKELVFSVAMGAFPVLAMAAVLFVVAGWRLAGAAAGTERLAHYVARSWVVLGLLLPLLALATWIPFLAFFGFGGPIALWGLLSLGILCLAAAMDRRAAKRSDAPVEPIRLKRATLLVASLLVGVMLYLVGFRLVGRG